MNDGLEVTPSDPLGLVQFSPSCVPIQHGDVCEYDVATIPPADDSGWRPAPDPDVIGFSIFPSRVCQAPITCLAYGDFTYFQTFVDVPANVAITQFTISFDGMDDGARVSIFNSAFPGGFVVPGSYVFLGGSGTTDLHDLVRSGEVNRVVVTQVDDCCVENNLRSAVVVLNGQIVHTGCNSAADCSDGDACTNDVCNPDGSCSHLAVVCDDANACTIDACDSTVGCVFQPLDCSDSNACTSDTCEPAGGCQHVNQCPDCSAATATVATIWPPDHKLVSIGVNGVTDPQGQSTTIRFEGIMQDEPTDASGDGNTCPDADGVGTDSALVRAERSGTPKTPGDGRVYHLFFSATDPDGFSCTGQVTTCVPHDQSKTACVDEGALYDSLVCGP
jgi:hypothetical protein